MSNAINKLTIAAIIASSVISSCKTEAERRAAEAEKLRSQAEQLVNTGNYGEAMALLDSIDTSYKEQTVVRRNAMGVRAAAIEARSIQQIGPADKRVAEARMLVDSLAPLFTDIEGPRGLEGYTVAKEIARQDITAAGGIQPRLDSDGYMSIATVVKRKRLGLNSISLTTASGTVAIEPVADNRRIDSEGAELVVFRQEEITDLLEELSKAEGSEARIHLDGKQGSTEIHLTSALRKALVDSWRYAMARQSLRSALIERERLERTLQTARDHRANAPLPSPETE